MRILAITFALLALAGCGAPPTARCGTDCMGCCSSDGQCRDGTTAFACGQLGNACESCALGTVCRFGMCAAPVLVGGGVAGGTGGGLAGGSGGGLAGGTSGGLAGGTGGLAGGSGGGLAGGTAGGLAGGTSGGLAGGTAGGLAGGTAGGLAGGTSGGLAGGTSGGLAGGTGGGLAGGTAGGLAGGTGGGLAGGTGGGLAGGTSGGLAGGTSGGLAGGTAGGLAGGTSGGLAGGTSGGLAGGASGGLAGGTGGGGATGGCQRGCPPGYTCDIQGACSGSSISGLVLNVLQAPQVTVSGTVLLNGLQPTSGCGSSNRATVNFKSTVGSVYDTTLSVPCNGATTPFAFSGLVYPGTYDVTVTGGFSNLPQWPVAVQQVVVNGPISGLTLNVLQAPQVTVSGTVLLNGAQPTSGCGSSNRATVNFKSTLRDVYDTTLSVPCNGATTPFAFSGLVYPGTYDVTVTGGFSNLPQWPVAIQQVVVSGPISGLMLNVLQAPQVTVSGTVLLNGLQPTSGCGSSNRATVNFKSTLRDVYDTTLSVPCNGATTPFAFSGLVYPGTYDVTVTGGFSNLPQWPVAIQQVVVSASISGLTLNVLQAPQVTVSGTVLLNGLQPTSGCGSSNRATVNFKSANRDVYDTTLSVPCNGATTPFAFSGLVYPGTYDVTVTGGFSNLPQWPVAIQQVVVSGPISGLMLNVVQAPQVTVSGTVLLNGAQPTSGCGSSNRATVNFRSTTRDVYDTTLSVPCNGATTPFAFSGLVYPGTYDVSVTGGFSNLPQWPVAVQQVVVSAPTAGLTLNVLQAPQVTVSGTVLLNGAQPTSGCGSSNRATVSFRSLSSSVYDTSLSVPCNGATTPFTFSGLVYPGVYEIAVTGGFANLPQWRVVVVDALRIP